MKKVFLFIAVVITVYATAQTNTFPSTGAAGIGTTTPNASSLLDITSTSKGILIPRMTKAQRDAIGTPAAGLLIYQTDTNPGFYYYSGTAWTAVSAKGANTSLSNLVATTAINSSLLPGVDLSKDLGSAAQRWNNIYAGSGTFSHDIRVHGLTIGRGGGSQSTNTAVGNGALIQNTTGQSNVASGDSALFSNTEGNSNVANGRKALYNNQSGRSNVAIGLAALFTTTRVSHLVAVGDSALYSNTAGDENVAIGSAALRHNTVGVQNVANGYQALNSNRTGYENVALGDEALYSNTIGDNNAASGYQALYFNEVGFNNTASGSQALYSNTDGLGNVASGYRALYSNTDGADNTASGSSALYSNTRGNDNVASGSGALLSNTTGNDNVALGEIAFYHNTTGSKNTALGSTADVASGNLTNAMALGYDANVNASNKVVIGNTSITVIGGKVGWSTFSDGRFKSNIKENVPGLEFIKKLKPVTYNLQLQKFDKFLGKKDSLIKANAADYAIGEKKIHTGFVAQEVEKAAEELKYDFDGVNHPQNDKDNYSLVYADFVPSLVKGMQELSSQNDSLKQQNNTQQTEISDLQNQINELKAMIVSNQSSASNQQATIISSPSLSQNIPNPFNNTTTINYTLPQTYTSAKIVVTDKSGKALKEVNLPAGRQGLTANGKGSLQLTASTLSSGAYQYSLFVDGRLIDTKQMVLAR